MPAFEKCHLTACVRQRVSVPGGMQQNDNIWIDLDNSPHVPLFVPLISHYRSRGIDVTLTARNHAQTIEMLRLAGLEGTFTVIGRHHGKSKVHKIGGLVTRSLELVKHIREVKRLGNHIAVAVSHGSRSMVLAAKCLNIPILTMYDYEFTETRVFNRLSDKVLVPDSIPDATLDEIGLKKSKRVKYPGIKEELYARAFRQTLGFRERFIATHAHEAGNDKLLAVLRPPATTANYHSEKSDVLLDDLLHFLLNAADVVTVVVPRTAEQALEIRAKIANFPDAGQRAIVLKEAVDGLDLLNAADLVISGGGTMNREAALLGVPVYSIFAGRQGALDRQMEAAGQITFIRDARDLSKIRLERRTQLGPNTLTDRVESFVIEQIDAYLDKL